MKKTALIKHRNTTIDMLFLAVNSIDDFGCQWTELSIAVKDDYLLVSYILVKSKPFIVNGKEYKIFDCFSLDVKEFIDSIEWATEV